MALECGKSVIEALNQHPRIQFLYSQDARVLEKYTIREHSETVVRQFMEFFAQNELPALITRGEFLLILGLHDAGKPIPKDKKDQHAATLDLLRCLRDQLPVSERVYELAQFLIGRDLIGNYIQSAIITRSSLETRERVIEVSLQGQLSRQHVDEMVNEVTFIPLEQLHGHETFTLSLLSVAHEIARAAAHFGMSGSELFDLLITYYQCDTSAYTAGARSFSGKCSFPGLDFLYERNDPKDPSTYLIFCEEKKRLKFVPYVEALLDTIRSSILSFTPIEVSEAKSNRP